MLTKNSMSRVHGPSYMLIATRLTRIQHAKNQAARSRFGQRRSEIWSSMWRSARSDRRWLVKVQCQFRELTHEAERDPSNCRSRKRVQRPPFHLVS
ncbi:hypothetical protein GLOTRDRAFT_116647 [Gloeophyllum trabeum ATCC 11539]|uniref:Uncharacterized protein n=1 Tax=Gloeophyllum trabeum (strain ATCC 11539 / FP-39264 / Madison 617) TaxID=670483 RepID=S7Q2X8_GLOTA|nr:uncharacterized protein GLOTRDRAFT_116647 [Gloeophyllum trabeum ATCC 11539]EPQ53897.1 hypothetical protein GLOTRDRAFT_116647 [Gloeophyllum trabeum ATCC 11539]